MLRRSQQPREALIKCRFQHHARARIEARHNDQRPFRHIRSKRNQKGCRLQWRRPLYTRRDLGIRGLNSVVSRNQPLYVFQIEDAHRPLDR